MLLLTVTSQYEASMLVSWLDNSYSNNKQASQTHKRHDMIKCQVRSMLPTLNITHG